MTTFLLRCVDLEYLLNLNVLKAILLNKEHSLIKQPSLSYFFHLESRFVFPHKDESSSLPTALAPLPKNFPKIQSIIYVYPNRKVNTPQNNHSVLKFASNHDRAVRTLFAVCIS